MSGTPCGSCPRWVPESGSSIFCTLGGGSFQLVRLALDPKFTARDFLDLSSRITHLIGEFTVRVGSSVQEVSSHPPPPPPPPRQNSSQEGRGPPSSPPQRAQGITQAPRGQPGLETLFLRPSPLILKAREKAPHPPAAPEPAPPHSKSPVVVPPRAASRTFGLPAGGLRFRWVWRSENLFLAVLPPLFR